MGFRHDVGKIVPPPPPPLCFWVGAPPLNWSQKAWSLLGPPDTALSPGAATNSLGTACRRLGRAVYHRYSPRAAAEAHAAEERGWDAEVGSAKLFYLNHLLPSLVLGIGFNVLFAAWVFTQAQPSLSYSKVRAIPSLLGTSPSMLLLSRALSLPW